MHFRTTYTWLARLWLCTAACVLPGLVCADDAGAVLDLLAEMEQAWSTVDDYSKRVEKTERLVDGDVTEQLILIKYRQPGQFYMKVLQGPNKGGELIYPAREGSKLAVAHAGGLKGGLARLLMKTVILRRVVPTEFALDDPQIGEWQHQTVPDTSFGATIARIANNVRSGVESGEGVISLAQDCDDTDQCLLRLDFTFPPDAGQQHTVRDGETLWTIASSYDQSMYSIWYNNPRVSGPRQLKPGQILFIPRYYAASSSVWVSPRQLLPVKIEVHDAAGNLYERYIYSDVRINVGLTDLDFDTANPDYRY